MGIHLIINAKNLPENDLHLDCLVEGVAKSELVGAFATIFNEKPEFRKIIQEAIVVGALVNMKRKEDRDNKHQAQA